jgi:hypothetical protein
MMGEKNQKQMERIGNFTEETLSLTYWKSLWRDLGSEN